SFIGGSDAGDDTPGGRVPNYYGLGSVWSDTGTGAAYGAVAFEPVNAWFWRDEAGAQHPDVYRRVDVALEPGKTWRAPAGDPAIFVFGLQAPPGARPWNAFRRSAAAFVRQLSR
ncbi:MAG: hypothetical protein AAB368_16755, partial [bacterium]